MTRNCFRAFEFLELYSIAPQIVPRSSWRGDGFRSRPRSLNHPGARIRGNVTEEETFRVTDEPPRQRTTLFASDQIRGDARLY